MELSRVICLFKWAIQGNQLWWFTTLFNWDMNSFIPWAAEANKTFPYKKYIQCNVYVLRYIFKHIMPQTPCQLANRKAVFYRWSHWRALLLYWNIAFWLRYRCETWLFKIMQGNHFFLTIKIIMWAYHWSYTCLYSYAARTCLWGTYQSTQITSTLFASSKIQLVSKGNQGRKIVA